MRKNHLLIFAENFYGKGDKKVNDLNKMNAIKKLGDLEMLAVFIGIIITVPMLALLGSAIYAVMVDRSGGYMGILLTIILMLVFWAIIWGGIWMVSVLRANNIMQSNSVSRLDELERENERLQKLVTELSQEKQLQNDSK
jgi:uncharacterized membrane protein